MSDVDLSAILKLSVSERLRLVQDVWDSIAAESDPLPVTDEERSLIDERMAAYRRAPEKAMTWEAARKRILLPM